MGLILSFIATIVLIWAMWETFKTMLLIWLFNLLFMLIWLFGFYLTYRDIIHTFLNGGF